MRSTGDTAVNGAPSVDAQATAWVEGFKRGWDNPPSPEEAAKRFESMLAPEMRMIQPQLPDLVGSEEAMSGFWKPLFALLPDVRVVVERWAARDDTLWIELTMSGTLGGKPVSFGGVDVIRLRDGVATERIAYVDSLPVLAAVARRPRSWPAFARYQRALLRHRRRRDRTRGARR